MTTDLEVRTIVSPATGQVVDLSAPSEDLASILDETRELEVKLRYFKSKLGDELIARLDRSAQWTQRIGEYEVSAPSPAPKAEYDGNALYLLLEELVSEQQITEEAKQEAVEVEVSYKPRVRGINNLLKLGGAIAERIDGTKREVERTRYAKVRRLRP